MLCLHCSLSCWRTVQIKNPLQMNQRMINNPMLFLKKDSLQIGKIMTHFMTISFNIMQLILLNSSCMAN